MKSLTLLKLGGAAITDKSKVCTPNIPLIESVAEQVASYPDKLILLHGAGSYGHPIVTKARLQLGYHSAPQLRFVTETELYLDQLTRIIGVSLLLHGKSSVPIRPMSFIMMRNGEIANSFVAPIKFALKLGLIPLIHGDLTFDSNRGWGVVSADRIASYLGILLRASRVLYGCDVDGVYDEDPKTSSKAQLIEEVGKENAYSILRRLAKSPRKDATGGMLGKVKEALRVAKSGRECYIFNLKRRGAVNEALRGKLSRSTRFVAWRREPSTS